MAKDILLSDDFDLLIKDGDLAVGESGGQNIKLVLLSHKGNWKQTPWLGVGLDGFLLEDATNTEIKQEIRKQLRADGAKVRAIRYRNGELDINANYV